jgi:hypothetical protein
LADYLIVYVAPVGCWAAIGWLATLLGDERTAGPGVKALMAAVIAPAIEGFRDVGAYAWVVVHLALIAAFAVKPHAVTGALSVLALVAWLMWGVSIVTIEW